MYRNMTEVPKKVIIFNGPPSSGKDECCAYVQAMFDNVTIQMFKSKLFELVIALYNISPDDFYALYDNREKKELPTCKLNGLSPREAMIFVSEMVVKPNYGAEYFGMIAAEYLQLGLNVFSDGGFPEELTPVLDECNGAMLIVQLHRPGYDYEGDSRSYIDEFYGVPIIKLHNDQGLDILMLKIYNIIIDFMEGKFHE
jgi:hypothetical protein